MTKAQSTKRALLMSILSLIVCVSMLVGTTFAWFTDSVTSANNIIKSGNLDIELEYWNGTTWRDVKGASDILTNTLWEPGVTEVAYLRVVNAGSLALKYQLGINILSEIEGKNQANETFKLSDYIEFGVVEGVNGENGKYATREDAVAALTSAKKISEGYSKASSMLSGDKLYLALVVYMPTTVGNVANHNGTDIPQIDIGINVFATQLASEEDSFDEYYDINSAAFTVDEANEQLAMNLDVSLVNCNEPDGILYVPAGYTGTLTLHNVTIASIQEMGAISTLSLNEEKTATAATNIVMLGKVVVKATKNGMSAITGTNLNISGTGHLTAVGKGKAAFGIGGLTTESITISGITVDYVEGGCAYGVGTDTKFYKDAPEGGAAIGSGFNGAVITLNNATVTKAIGGSKAAAIGARYHTGVTVNIIDSVIGYAEGGVSAAGIGGSRISSGATESGTTINITKSTITAKGGAYGAGIGSGYDTHCQASQPLCTINIVDSTINATGGKYAAGVGTGYHNAALAGEIKNSTVNAAAGEIWYKAEYTSAMNIGFGVTDPTREGQQTDSKIIYNGQVISLTDAPKYTYVADGVLLSTDGNTYFISNRAGYTWMDSQADNFFGNKTIKLAADIDFGGDTIKGIKFWNSHPVFDGQGHTLSNFVIAKSGSKTPSGLFHGTFDVKNLVVDGAKVTGDYAGGISGQMYGNIDNCTVKNSTITSTYWQGGGLAGQYNAGNVTKSTVENCKISGGSAIGGLIGILNETSGERKVEDCTVKDCTITRKNGFGGDYDNYFGAAVGIINIENSKVYFNGCTIKGVTVNGFISDALYGDVEESTTVFVDGAQIISTTEALKAAIEAKTSKVVLANGEYALRFTNQTSFNVDGMTIVGLGNNVKLSISSSEVWYGRVQGDNVTFENIKFTSSVGATGKATYNDCTFADWTICACSGGKETYFNKCEIAILNTSSDFNSGNVYVKDSDITKAEYSFNSANSVMNFENCEIGELISWNANTVLTNCTVTTLDDSHMTTGTITKN